MSEPLQPPLILASQSATRVQMLRNAGLEFSQRAARIDEEMLRASLEAEEASPRDIADALAEAKARKVSGAEPGALVIGCDQVGDHRGRVLGKPATPADAEAQITALAGDRHALHSAVVLYEDGKPVWRHIGTTRLRMRQLSPEYVEDYVSRNWEHIRHSAGGYRIEEEAARFFTSIEGDYFTILGLPLLELLSYLALRGIVRT